MWVDFGIDKLLFAVQFLQAGIFLRVLVVPLPIQVGDLIGWAHFGSRIAMAIKAESHAKGLIMIDFLHFVNRAVTFDTAYPAIDVDRMVEVNKIRHPMDLHPRNRLATLSALADECEAQVVFEHLVVAIHASCAGRNIRIPGFFDRVMTITAVNTKLAGMSRVREGDRLDRLISNPGIFGCQIIPCATHYCRADQDEGNENHQGQPVRPFWKNC